MAQSFEAEAPWLWAQKTWVRPVLKDPEKKLNSSTLGDQWVLRTLVRLMHLLCGGLGMTQTLVDSRQEL